MIHWPIEAELHMISILLSNNTNNNKSRKSFLKEKVMILNLIL